MSYDNDDEKIRYRGWAKVQLEQRIIPVRGLRRPTDAMRAPEYKVEEMIERAQALGLHDIEGNWTLSVDRKFRGESLFEEVA